MLKGLFQGYLTRKMFVVRYIISVVGFFAGVSFLNLVSKNNAGVASSYMVGFFALFLAVYMYLLSLYVRRLRDAGKSPFLAIMIIIVPLQLPLLLYVLLVPSKKY